MKALILAAGRGSRMGELTEEQPKAMVPLAGKRLCDWQITALRAAGISDIALVTGYRAHLFEAFPVTCFYNPEWQHSNMVRSMIYADSWLSSDATILSYSDIFYQKEAVQTLADSRHDISVLYDVGWLEQWQLRFTDPLSDAETFKISASGKIYEIGARASSYDEIEGQYMGLLKFTPAGWQKIQSCLAELSAKEIDKLSMTALLNHLIGQGVAVHGVPFNGLWGEVDTQSDLDVHQKRLQCV